MPKENGPNWSRFFWELDKIVKPEAGQSAGERADQIISMAKEEGSESSLDTFLSFFGAELPE